MINRKLGTGFDKVSGLYDRVRGGYPKQLITGVIKESNLTESSRILDIGCGTGKSTLPFAAVGCRITALDPSKNMVAVAKRNLSEYHSIKYVVSTFETAPFDKESFDLAVSGNAFHWLDPESAYRKAGLIIKKGGHLAIFWSFSDYTRSEFLRKARELFMRNIHDYPDLAKLELEVLSNIKKTKLFGKPLLLNYKTSEEKTPAQWLNRVRSLSWFVSSPEPVRKRTIAKLKDLIKERKEDVIEFPRVHKLVLARRL